MAIRRDREPTRTTTPPASSVTSMGTSGGGRPASTSSIAARTWAAICGGRFTPGAWSTVTVSRWGATGAALPPDGSASGSAAPATETIAVRLPSKLPKMILGIDDLTMCRSDALDDRTGPEGKPNRIFSPLAAKIVSPGEQSRSEPHDPRPPLFVAALAGHRRLPDPEEAAHRVRYAAARDPHRQQHRIGERSVVLASLRPAPNPGARILAPAQRPGRGHHDLRRGILRLRDLVLRG